VFGIGMTELLVILVIGLLVLGPKRLPELARSLGRGLAEFRRASSDMRREFLDVAEEVRSDPAADEAEKKKRDAPAIPPALAGKESEPEREETDPPSGEPRPPTKQTTETGGG
jgi:Tat protein translocase TatB subunit